MAWENNYYPLRNTGTVLFTERMRLFYDTDTSNADQGGNVQITGKTFTNVASQTNPYNEDDYTRGSTSVNKGNGAGAIVTGGHVTFTSCDFRGSTAANNGGGLYVDDGFADLTGPIVVKLTNCTFEDNDAIEGGALYVTMNRPSYWFKIGFLAHSQLGH